MLSTLIIYNYFQKSTGICTDSRILKKGEIFFAINGPNFDGNQFVSEAIKKGCLIAVSDDPELAENSKIIKVEDSLRSLQDLAKLHRKNLNIPVLAITGSNGKTTTKELIATALSNKFKVLATKGNYNNHIGVPLTLLKIKEEDFAIIEMGANHPGEIHLLCEIAQPNFGIITNIGRAHLEGFGSFEGVKRTKAELYHYINQVKGTLFINGNNEILQDISKTLSNKKIRYINGENLICDGYIAQNNIYPQIHLKFINGNEHLIKVKLTGAYNLENYLAAACVAKYFEIDEEKICNSFEEYTPDNNRSQHIITENNEIILDAYNANPSSMLESVSNFLQLYHSKKMIVLGDMLELGKYSLKEHKSLLENLKDKKFSNVFLVGSEFQNANKDFSFKSFENINLLIEHFRSNPVTDHLILLKASRGIQLEKLKEVL
jgi:UDP-N-acetylmuramoyl-tripeptide--D-alanyl-D-alanine ligase